jgi:hypothetical protein
MRGVIWDNRCTSRRATPIPSNDQKREMRVGCGTLQVLQPQETQQQSVTVLRRADPRQKRPDPAHTQHRKLEFFAGLTGNAQQWPWQYPGLAEARLRVLVRSRSADLPGPLTRQNYFSAATPDQLST